LINILLLEELRHETTEHVFTVEMCFVRGTSG